MLVIRSDRECPSYAPVSAWLPFVKRSFVVRITTTLSLATFPFYRGRERGRGGLGLAAPLPSPPASTSPNRHLPNASLFLSVCVSTGSVSHPRLSLSLSCPHVPVSICVSVSLCPCPSASIPPHTSSMEGRTRKEPQFLLRTYQEIKKKGRKRTFALRFSPLPLPPLCDWDWEGWVSHTCF